MLVQRIDDFFSKEITHFITLHDVDDKENKEKEPARAGSASAAAAATGGGLLASPIKLRGRYVRSSTMSHTTLTSALRRAQCAHGWHKGRVSCAESPVVQHEDLVCDEAPQCP